MAPRDASPQDAPSASSAAPPSEPEGPTPSVEQWIGTLSVAPTETISREKVERTLPAPGSTGGGISESRAPIAPAGSDSSSGPAEFEVAATLPPPSSSAGASSASGEDFESSQTLPPSQPSTGGGPTKASPLPTDLGPARFVLETPIGEGGMGEVWEAEQKSLRRTIAVKRILRQRLAEYGPDSGWVRGAVRDFQNEALITARLEHPNIIPVHDLGYDDAGTPLLAMKRVVGRPWNDILDEDFDEFSADEFLHQHIPILIAVSQGVAFAHAQGIVHRDLKPAQVMIGAFGETLLMDWGLAVFVGTGTLGPAVQPPDNILPTLATSSNPAGTPALMAPEQTRSSADAIGPWTDIFLLGGTLYYLLTGTYPYSYASTIEAISAARVGEIESPRKRRPDRPMPDTLVALCEKCLSREPRSRPLNVREFIAGLEDYLHGTSRRREAEEMVARASEHRMAEPAKDDPHGYDAISESLDLLQRAQAAWPDLEGLGAEFDETLSEYARRALAAGDLKLARLHAERITIPAARDGYVSEVTQREEEIAKNEKQRKRMRRAFVILLILLSTYMTRTASQLGEKNDELERERAFAASRAADAEQLTAFLLDELGRGLDLTSTRNRTLRDSIVARVVTTTMEASVDEFPPAERIAHANAAIATANNLFDLGAYQESNVLAEYAVEVLRNPDDEEMVSPLDIGRAEKVLGRTLESLGKYAEGMEHADAARKLIETAKGATVLDRIAMLTLWGDLQAEMANYEEAEKALLDAVALVDTLNDPSKAPQGRDSPLLQLASFYTMQNRFEEVEPFVARLREIYPLHELTDARDAGLIVTVMALYELRRGNMEEAREAIDIGMDLVQNGEDPNHPNHASFYQIASMQAQMEERYDEALVLIERGIEIVKSGYGERHPYFGFLTTSKASLLTAMGRNEEAADHYEQAIKTLEQVFEPGHTNMAAIRLAAGMGLVRAGRKRAALDALKEALPHLSQNYPNFERSRLGITQQIANLHYELEEYDEALKIALELLPEYEADPETYASVIPRAKVFIAAILVDSGNYRDAEPYLSELEEREARLAEEQGEEYQGVPVSLRYWRARTWEADGDVARADVEYREVLPPLMEQVLASTGVSRGMRERAERLGIPIPEAPVADEPLPSNAELGEAELTEAGANDDDSTDSTEAANVGAAE